MNKNLPKNLTKFIWYFLKSYKLVTVIYILLAILAGFWGPFSSLLLKKLINILPSVSNENIYSLIKPAALIVINFIVFDNITWRSINYINYKYQSTIKNKIISETFKFVLSNSQRYFENNLSGRISSQINIIADNIEQISQKISPNLIRSTSLLIISFITSYYANSIFFYVLIVWFIIFFSFSILMSKHIINLSDRHASSESIVSGQLVDSITNNNTVRIFAKNNYEASRMEQFFAATKKAFQSKEFFLITVYCIQGMMIATMMGFVGYFLIDLYLKNKISIGDFALIITLSMELGHMMWGTMGHIDMFNEAVGKCKQSLSRLIIDSEINDKPNADKLILKKGEIYFDSVKFHYKGTDPLFTDISITIKAGQKVGLVGYSGSGKTTFVNLILRLYDVTDGGILIDKQDIRDVSQASLRQSIGFIPQDPSLFHRSIMDNIRYGKTEATEQEVVLAAKKAYAHEFIIKLPEGYESLVGERGIKLSGGQRQRISIARTILKNAPILILDEATSQLDSINENFIQDSLSEFMKGTTTIVIAHRLSTLLNMDRILVFDKGKILEDGTHEDLLKNGGLYKTLWNSQSGGLLPE